MEPAVKKAIEYFSARGCSFSGEITGRGIYKFALPKEGREDGRLVVNRSGQVKVWHMTAKAELDLGRGWKAGDPVAFGPRPLPTFVSDLSVLNVAEKTPIRRAYLSPEVRERKVYSDNEMSQAVGAILSAEGWAHKFTKGGIEYWNDGTGSTPACRVHIADGIASVWSHRSEVDLPSPFRPGRTTKDGHKTMYVTGRDLELESLGTRTVAPPVMRQEKEQAINQATVDFVRSSWHAGRKPLSNHPQLTKAGAQLDTGILRQFPDCEETRKRYCASDLLVPIFRPSKAGQANLELVGGQRLMARPWQGNDKLMLPGTPVAGSFVPIPPGSVMTEKASLSSWMESLGRHRIESRPLVICEGVSTGAAIHQANAGNVLCALSSNNLPAIAKWVKESGLDQNFPAGVVIAADLDIGRDGSGRLKSNAIPKAVEAAEIVNGRVALAPTGNPTGTDARDLLGIGGTGMVRDYINQAVAPEDMRKRHDVFPPVVEKDRALMTTAIER